MRLIIAFILLALGGISTSFAQSGPVEITADRFVVSEGEQEATFSGNVVVKQTGVTVYAQKLLVRYGPGGASDLKDFEATGRVKVVQPDQTATGDRGIYNPTTQILRLRGNVTVTNDSGTVRGPELIVNIGTGRSEFAGAKGTGRVTGIFNADEAGN
jgi:lipopolysaccharide export system protein LptA